MALVCAALAVSSTQPLDAQGADGCTLTGTPLDDVLRGGGGRDVICGLGGNDRVYGEEGDDELRGGEGADRLFGAGGDDALDGGTGDDALDAGSGANRCTDQERIPTGGACIDTLTIKRLAIAPRRFDTSRGPRGIRIEVEALDTRAADAPRLLAQFFAAIAYRGDQSVAFEFLGTGSGRTQTEGVWEGTIEMPKNSPGGRYGLTLNSSDSEEQEPPTPGAEAIFTPEVLQAGGMDPFFSQGGKGDRDPPRILDIALTPKRLSTAERPRKVKVAVKAADATGVLNMDFTVEGPRGIRRFVQLDKYALERGTKQRGTWIAYLRLPRYAARGRWNLDYAILHDELFNRRLLRERALARLGVDRAFVQTGRDDRRAPELEGLSISPSRFDTTKGPVNLDVAVTASDDLSGIEEGYIAFKRPVDDFSYAYGFFWGRSEGGSIERTFPFGGAPMQAPPGPGDYLVRLMLVDATGNRRLYGSEELAARGLPSTVHNGP